MRPRVPCNCRSRCSSTKRSSCRSLGLPCLAECHVGHSRTNDNSVHVLASVDLTQVDSEHESPDRAVGRSCKNWTKIDTVQLKQRHKAMIKSGAWLDDLVICAAQSLLQ